MDKDLKSIRREDDDLESVGSVDSEKTLVADERTLVSPSIEESLLSEELGVTKGELEGLNYKELVVLGEAINREYDARERNFEDELKEKINIDLQVLNEHVPENGATENEKSALQEKKRKALMEIMKAGQILKEKRETYESERKRLLDECNVLIKEKTEDFRNTIENDEVLKKAIVNVSKTYTLNVSEVNRKLYEDFLDKAQEREREEDDEFYDPVGSEQEDLEYKIKMLSIKAKNELGSLEVYTETLLNKIKEVKKDNAPLAKKLSKDYEELKTYIVTYKRQQEEIEDIVATYNESKELGIFTKEGNIFVSDLTRAIYNQVTKMKSEIEKTSSEVSNVIEKRGFNVLEEVIEEPQKVRNVEKKEPDIVTVKENLNFVNIVGANLVLINKNKNEIRGMTKEERFLVNKIKNFEKNVPKVNDLENTNWSKEMKTTIGIAYDIVRNGSSTTLSEGVRPYKIDNNKTVNALKENIAAANRSNTKYEDAQEIVKDAINDCLPGHELDINSLTSEDCKVLAQMIDEKYTTDKEREKKEIRDEVLNEINNESVNSKKVGEIYRNVGESIASEYKERNSIRDAFNAVIAKKESVTMNDSSNKTSQSILVDKGIVDSSNSYSNYINKYKKEQVATPDDIKNILKKVQEASVDGGYYYVVLDNEKNDMIANIGKPVISSKGVTVIKIDESRLNLDNGEFFEDVYLESSYKQLGLSKDRIYTVEQDREIDKTEYMIADEKERISIDTMLRIDTDSVIPRLTPGFERQIEGAKLTLEVLNHIHGREGNTEYEQEETFINGLSEKIDHLNEAIDVQEVNAKKLINAVNAYKEFKNAVGLGGSEEVDKNVENILYKEYTKAKANFEKQSSNIRSKVNDLSVYQGKIHKEKFNMDIEQETKQEQNVIKEEEKQQEGFFGKVKNFFGDVTEGIKNALRNGVKLFTPNSMKEKVDNIACKILGIDKSDGSAKGLGKWAASIISDDMGSKSEDLKNKYMELAKRRDEENRKRVTNEKGEDNVLSKMKDLKKEGLLRTLQAPDERRTQGNKKSKNVEKNRQQEQKQPKNGM